MALAGLLLVPELRFPRGPFQGKSLLTAVSAEGVWKICAPRRFVGLEGGVAPLVQRSKILLPSNSRVQLGVAVAMTTWPRLSTSRNMLGVAVARPAVTSCAHDARSRKRA